MKVLKIRRTQLRLSVLSSPPRRYFLVRLSPPICLIHPGRRRIGKNRLKFILKVVALFILLRVLVVLKMKTLISVFRQRF